MSKAINFAAFQAGWFACILGAAHGAQWLGPAVVGTFAAVGLFARRKRVAFVMRLAAAIPLGFFADTALARLGVLQFETSASPLWMTALWPNLATTLDSSLGWLAGKYGLAAGVGAFAGPAAYYAGARLGALQIDESVGSLAAIAIEWAVSLPLLLFLTARWNRMEEAAA